MSIYRTFAIAALFGTFFLIVTMASLSHELITPATGGTLFGLWFASFWTSLIALSWAHDNRH